MSGNIYPVIGMSPGNSYFKDAEVEHLLRETVQRYGQTAILIADIPAIATYLAYGYPENRARNKAIPKGNNLKNRSRRIAEQLGISNKVRIIDWANEVENSDSYKEIYNRIRSLYDSNQDFKKAVNNTTKEVLEGGEKDIADLEAATDVAVHYLLSELAFLEFSPKLLESEQVVYVYHRNWPVYERYVSGLYDGQAKSYLDFLLLENPTETYRTVGSEQMIRIKNERVLRCAFTSYPPGFIEDETTGDFSGIFHDLIQEFTRSQNWDIEWAEKVGYGVIQHGLNEGRYDVFVAPVWPTPERQQVAAFSSPVYFSNVGMWVREENAEQAKTEDISKNSFVRVAIKEGDITDSIAKADYSAWRPIRVAQLTDTEELLRFVAQGDADVTFAEQFLVDLFNQNSPVKLVNIADQPVRTFSNCFMLSSQNSELKDALNIFLDKKMGAGEIANLLEKYAPKYQQQGISLKK